MPDTRTKHLRLNLTPQLKHVMNDVSRSVGIQARETRTMPPPSDGLVDDEPVSSPSTDEAEESMDVDVPVAGIDTTSSEAPAVETTLRAVQHAIWGSSGRDARAASVEDANDDEDEGDCGTAGFTIPDDDDDDELTQCEPGVEEMSAYTRLGEVYERELVDIGIGFPNVCV